MIRVLGVSDMEEVSMNELYKAALEFVKKNPCDKSGIAAPYILNSGETRIKRRVTEIKGKNGESEIRKMDTGNRSTDGSCNDRNRRKKPSGRRTI